MPHRHCWHSGEQQILESKVSKFPLLLTDLFSSWIWRSNAVLVYPALTLCVENLTMRQNLRSWTCLHLTPELAPACYFSLLQQDPKTSLFLLFLPRTDGRICWNFQISPRQRQKALRCLFVEFQHIQSSDSEHFQKEFQFRSRDSSWVIERESEEPNGSKIERGWHNLNSIPGMKWLFWDEVDRPFLRSAKKAGKREGWHPTVLVRGQQAKRKVVVSLSRIMERLRHQPFTKESVVSGNLRGLCGRGDWS